MNRHEHIGSAARRRVVVGVSDSPAGRAALHVAIDIAARGRRPLHLVRVWRDVDWFMSAPMNAMDILVADEHAEQRMFAQACAEARQTGVEVTGEFVPGDLYTSLQERTEGAELLVIGTSGAEGENSGLLTRWFTDNSHCPVIVVDAEERIVAYRSHLPAVHQSVG